MADMTPETRDALLAQRKQADKIIELFDPTGGIGDDITAIGERRSHLQNVVDAAQLASGDDGYVLTHDELTALEQAETDLRAAGDAFRAYRDTYVGLVQARLDRLHEALDA